MKPVLQALVLAEKIYEAKGSGQKIIAGTFNALEFSRTSPIQEMTDDEGNTRRSIRGGTHGGSPSAYISLTDVCNNTELQLQFVSLTRNKTIFSTKLVINSQNRLQTVELVIPLPVLFVPEPGVYAFEVVCEGEVIGSHRITAREIQPTEETED